MTRNAIEMMQIKIRKDRSLSEERKPDLLNLLNTINPEITELYKSQTEYASRMIRLNKRSIKNDNNENLSQK
jgi:hypothetical protein